MFILTTPPALGITSKTHTSLFFFLIFLRSFELFSVHLSAYLLMPKNLRYHSEHYSFSSIRKWIGHSWWLLNFIFQFIVLQSKQSILYWIFGKITLRSGSYKSSIVAANQKAGAPIPCSFILYKWSIFLLTIQCTRQFAIHCLWCDSRGWFCIRNGLLTKR